jgi:hypothetical protein
MTLMTSKNLLQDERVPYGLAVTIVYLAKAPVNVPHIFISLLLIFVPYS